MARKCKEPRGYVSKVSGDYFGIITEDLTGLCEYIEFARDVLFQDQLPYLEVGATFKWDDDGEIVFDNHVWTRDEIKAIEERVEDLTKKLFCDIT